MGDARRDDAYRLLSEWSPGTLLDVGCGRGEVVNHWDARSGCEAYGIDPVSIGDQLNIRQGLAHELPFPDDFFDYVTMFDVIEHLLPGDDKAACMELARVAREGILLTAADFSHVVRGVELHINRRRYQEWHRLFGWWFLGYRVEWLQNQGSISETWRVSLNK